MTTHNTLTYTPHTSHLHHKTKSLNTHSTHTTHICTPHTAHTHTTYTHMAYIYTSHNTHTTNHTHSHAHHTHRHTYAHMLHTTHTHHRQHTYTHIHTPLPALIPSLLSLCGTYSSPQCTSSLYPPTAPTPVHYPPSQAPVGLHVHSPTRVSGESCMVSQPRSKVALGPFRLPSCPQ